MTSRGSLSALTFSPLVPSLSSLSAESLEALLAPRSGGEAGVWAQGSCWLLAARRRLRLPGRGPGRAWLGRLRGAGASGNAAPTERDGLAPRLPGLLLGSLLQGRASWWLPWGGAGGGLIVGQLHLMAAPSLATTGPAHQGTCSPVLGHQQDARAPQGCGTVTDIPRPRGLGEVGEVRQSSRARPLASLTTSGRRTLEAACGATSGKP